MVNYISSIDPHVHLRGEEYSQNYLGLGFSDARQVGLQAILEQPNPNPWLTTEGVIKSRLYKAGLYNRYVFHRIHIGMTNDLEQVKTALNLVISKKYSLISDKTFYVHSTGNMGILDPEIQKNIWKIKGELGYNGVSIGHFEAEDSFTGEFDPKNPISHSLKQNPEAELIQVERQIKNAKDYNFKGTFYIAHVSNPDTVDYIERENPNLPFQVIMEITFHHMFLNTNDYKIHGNRVKINPPLREPKLQERLLNYVLNGRLQIIGTDHAPHPIEKKDSTSPLSGIPTLPFWPKGIELLRENKIKKEILENLIFHNTNKIFQLNLTPIRKKINYDPSLWDSYGYNPFSRIDGSK